MLSCCALYCMYVTEWTFPQSNKKTRITNKYTAQHNKQPWENSSNICVSLWLLHCCNSIMLQIYIFTIFVLSTWLLRNFLLRISKLLYSYVCVCVCKCICRNFTSRCTFYHRCTFAISIFNDNNNYTSTTSMVIIFKYTVCQF